MTLEMPLDGKALERVRAVSRAVYKSEYILEIHLAVATHERVYATQIESLVPGAQGNFAANVIKRLVEVGMMQRLAKEEGQARDYYARRSSPYWEAVTPWVQALVDGDDGQRVSQLRPA